MRSYPSGQRQSLPRLRHTCRTACPIRAAAAISHHHHARIHSAAQAERTPLLFAAVVVRTAADAIFWDFCDFCSFRDIWDNYACGPTADAVLRGSAAVAAYGTVFRDKRDESDNCDAATTTARAIRATTNGTATAATARAIRATTNGTATATTARVCDNSATA